MAVMVVGILVRLPPLKLVPISSKNKNAVMVVGILVRLPRSPLDKGMWFCRCS